MVLKPNLHHGRQALPNLEVRTSVDNQSKESEEHGETRGEEHGETRSGNIEEYKVYHTQRFNKRMVFAEKQSRN